MQEYLELEEIPLAGGRITAGVVRVGGTVRRPLGGLTDLSVNLLGVTTPNGKNCTRPSIFRGAMSSGISACVRQRVARKGGCQANKRRKKRALIKFYSVVFAQGVCSKALTYDFFRLV
jgi:hypothetical protein